LDEHRQKWARNRAAFHPSEQFSRMETIKLLQRLRPRLAVLSPDGMPATVAQIPRHYAGPAQVRGGGAHRIHVRERLALDDDSKRPQR
jgi:hypothetical protein